MAAGGRFGDAAGGRSSRQRSPMGGRSAPPLRPPRGRSLSSRGGFSAARAAMTRCAHGRLANFCARGEQWMRLASCVNATVGGVWPLQPCCSGRRRWRLAATDRNTRTWPGKRCVWPPRRHTAVEERCDLQFGNSRACARAPSATCVKWVRTTLYSM